jgi:hypothetical protein
MEQKSNLSGSTHFLNLCEGSLAHAENLSRSPQGRYGERVLAAQRDGRYGDATSKTEALV